MGTHKNRLNEAVITSTHNLCFRAKIRKEYTPVNPSLLYKRGCKGVYITREKGCVCKDILPEV